MGAGSLSTLGRECESKLKQTGVGKSEWELSDGNGR